MNLIAKIEETSDFIMSKIGDKPEIAVILGSELGFFCDEIEDSLKIEYKDIPNFLASTIERDDNDLVFGKLKGKNVLVMKSRFNFYEDYKLSDITFPVRVMKKLGIEKLIVTNDSLATNNSLKARDLMIIKDHINFTFKNPLIGINYGELGNRFPDMSKVYDSKFIEVADSVAKREDIDLKSGTYAWITESYQQTQAAAKMLSNLGVDAAGVSTVPEAVIARYGKMRVLGISCITNKTLSSAADSIETIGFKEGDSTIKENFTKLVKGIVEKI